MFLRQKILSCPDRNMEVFNQLSHYEGLRLLPSVCGWKLIQQTLIIAMEYTISSYITIEHNGFGDADFSIIGPILIG